MFAKSADPAGTWTPPPCPTPCILFRIRSAPSSMVDTRFWKTARFNASWPSTSEGDSTSRVCPDKPPSTWQLMHFDCTTCSEMYSPNRVDADSEGGATPLNNGLCGRRANRAARGPGTPFADCRAPDSELEKTGHCACAPMERAVAPNRRCALARCQARLASERHLRARSSCALSSATASPAKARGMFRDCPKETPRAISSRQPSDARRAAGRIPEEIPPASRQDAGVRLRPGSSGLAGSFRTDFPPASWTEKPGKANPSHGRRLHSLALETGIEERRRRYSSNPPAHSGESGSDSPRLARRSLIDTFSPE